MYYFSVILASHEKFLLKDIAKLCGLPLNLVTALFYCMLNYAEKLKFRFSFLKGKEAFT